MGFVSDAGVIPLLDAMIRSETAQNSWWYEIRIRQTMCDPFAFADSAEFEAPNQQLDHAIDSRIQTEQKPWCYEIRIGNSRSDAFVDAMILRNSKLWTYKVTTRLIQVMLRDLYLIDGAVLLLRERILRSSKILASNERMQESTPWKILWC